MIASLMMYARPELEGAHARFWALIRQELADRGIKSPAELSNDAEEFAVWNDPTLVLSQTCGMPYRTSLHDRVTLIGTPDYGLEGCPPGYYRSPILVRRDDPRQSLTEFAHARFAYNAAISQSGFASIYHATKPLGFWFSDRRETGGHAISARMVANGEADIAALDAITWQLIERYDSFATNLRVLEWTEPTPGLPLIAASEANQHVTFQAVEAAIARLEKVDQAALGIKGLVAISKAAYLTVPNPPKEASD